MDDEEDLLPLSLLAQLVFCERRAALVCIEQLWDDNVFTAEGRLLHERPHESSTEVRGDVRIVRGLPLRSLRLGLSGKADVVEFHRLDPQDSPAAPFAQAVMTTGVLLPEVAGQWQPFPVEYKRGRRRHEEGYEAQLCAQALCLEEMLGGTIPSGALYYAKTGRRLEVSFDTRLRRETEEAAARLHELVREGRTPKARHEKKCKSCSLIDLCLPKATGSRRSARRYLAQAFAPITEDDRG